MTNATLHANNANPKQIVIPTSKIDFNKAFIKQTAILNRQA
jgi:hypothetical protein